MTAKPVFTETSGLEELENELFSKPGRDRRGRLWQQERAISRRTDLPTGKEKLEKLQIEDETLADMQKVKWKVHQE